MSGLEEQFPDRVRAANVDATTDQSMGEVEALDFRNHGLVIHSPDGDVLWKQPDHEVDMNDVREALRGLLEPTS